LANAVRTVFLGEKGAGMIESLANSRESPTPRPTMLRVRLKADGRIVEILPDGSEKPLSDPASARRREPDAAYARGVRARTKLTQAEFAARIGVPLETVRNWEQGKRSPRGPARALLKVIDKAPHVAFAVLGNDRSGG
jgi:putative transcriptional regulator